MVRSDPVGRNSVVGSSGARELGGTAVEGLGGTGFTNARQTTPAPFPGGPLTVYVH